MGKKAEVGTPKYLANKMKAKGLQKLRWYCQMCQKQCRDENGFKCHTTSESHQRNLLMFADNPGKFMGEFSKEFYDGFMDILRRQYGTKRVLANKVYQDYIGNKQHVHMNATRWCTLTGFVRFLGKAGHCVVDETEKGWFITWIDRNPETLARQERKEKKKRMDKDDEEKLMDFVEKQVEKGKASKGDEEEAPPEPREFVRTDEEEKISLQLKLAPKPSISAVPLPQLIKAELKDDDTKSVRSMKSYKSDDGKRKLSGLEEAMLEDMAMKKRKVQKEYRVKEENRLKEERLSSDDEEEEESWLIEGIIVKIVTKALGEKYHNQKAVITKVKDGQAYVEVLSTGHKLKLGEDHLQTVIPQPGKHVLILKGEYRGKKAILEEVLVDRFKAYLLFKSKDKYITKEVPYEHFSKLEKS
ncbi:DNA/RNA-binding protein KIN17 [Neocloeon triangulifer]|uniref:DNA/RNA-binding protein KIN17 n=1 Tax=Neocloeon triangulifer TaxID=2078957 RepID=UPI00286FAB44|nr:DNA/RNA-binding protein KIN17 [Neocloeon triangulifer]